MLVTQCGWQTYLKGKLHHSYTVREEKREETVAQPDLFCTALGDLTWAWPSYCGRIVILYNCYNWYSFNQCNLAPYGIWGAGGNIVVNIATENSASHRKDVIFGIDIIFTLYHQLNITNHPSFLPCQLTRYEQGREVNYTLWKTTHTVQLNSQQSRRPALSWTFGFNMNV